MGQGEVGSATAARAVQASERSSRTQGRLAAVITVLMTVKDLMGTVMGAMVTTTTNEECNLGTACWKSEIPCTKGQ